MDDQNEPAARSRRPNDLRSSTSWLSRTGRWLLQHSSYLVVFVALMVGIVASRFIPTGFGVALALSVVFSYRLGFDAGQFQAKAALDDEPIDPQ